MMLFDAHAHLQDGRIRAEADAVLDRAARAGVQKIACCGTCEHDWEAVRTLALRHPGLIIPQFGLHPWFVGERSREWLQTLRGYLTSVPSAVGEIGLDFAIEECDRGAQTDCFVRQLDIADELGRPVSVHCRKAWDALIGILETRGALRRGGMIHSYSGGPAHIGRLLPYGLYFSFSGSVTHAGNKKGTRSLRDLPPDRILIETDSPDMAPAGVEGPTEPAHLVHVIRAVSAVRGITEEEAARVTTENASRLFGGQVV